MKKLDPALSEIPRHELIAAALELGIERPEDLAPDELREQIRRMSESPEVPQPVLGKRALFAVARNLIASVVERGLNLPDAARVIRDTVRPSPKQKPPLPTVTLAQIYLSQGHTDKALQTLSQVIEREPNNYAAVALQQKLSYRGTQEQDATSERRSEGVAYTSPSLAPEPHLWYTGNELTRGSRNALVLFEPSLEQQKDLGEPAPLRLYWELSADAGEHLIARPIEVCMRCYSSKEAQSRDVLLPVHSPCGWAEVELLEGERAAACLRYVNGGVLATAINVRSQGGRIDVTKHRARAFYDDVVSRALTAQREARVI